MTLPCRGDRFGPFVLTDPFGFLPAPPFLRLKFAFRAARDRARRWKRSVYICGRGRVWEVTAGDETRRLV